MKSRIFRGIPASLLAFALVVPAVAQTETRVTVPEFDSAYGAPETQGALNDRLFFLEAGLGGDAGARLAPPLRVESATAFSAHFPEVALGFIRRRALTSHWEGRFSWGGSWLALERSDATGPSTTSSRTQLLGIVGIPLSMTLQWKGWRALHPFASLGIRPSIVLSPRSVIAERVSENHLDGTLGAGMSLALGTMLDALGTSELRLDWSLRRDLLASTAIDLSSGRWTASLALPWE